MSDERIGESEEMDRDLKEYLACFKSNEGKQPKPKVILPVKEKVHKDYEKVVKDPSSKILNSSKKNSLSEDSSLFSASSPHKRFNLQDVSDLQTSHMISESDVTPPSAKQGDDNNSVSAIGKLVLSLKELGSTSEDTALNNNSDSNDPTSSFNINANVFTVEDLVAADNIESTASKSPADNDNKVTDNIFKSTGREAKSYLDDFEEEDGEDTLVEESFVSESIKENVSSSNTTEIRPSKSDGSVELTSTAVSSSPDVDEDSSINTNQTEKTQTFHHSSTLQSTSASTESSPSKHEVAIQTDPSWKMINQPGAVNNAFLLDDSIQRSESETMALHNLVAQQLQLTRNLIDTARSLHHSQTLAIRPDYHYITLEDTKKFIETHKPKVLKMKKK